MIVGERREQRHEICADLWQIADRVPDAAFAAALVDVCRVIEGTATPSMPRSPSA